MCARSATWGKAYAIHMHINYTCDEIRKAAKNVCEEAAKVIEEKNFKKLEPSTKKYDTEIASNNEKIKVLKKIKLVKAEDPDSSEESEKSKKSKKDALKPDLSKLLPAERAEHETFLSGISSETEKKNKIAQLTKKNGELEKNKKEVDKKLKEYRKYKENLKNGIKSLDSLKKPLKTHEDKCDSQRGHLLRLSMFPGTRAVVGRIFVNNYQNSIKQFQKKLDPAVSETINSLLDIQRNAPEDEKEKVIGKKLKDNALILQGHRDYPLRKKAKKEMGAAVKHLKKKSSLSAIKKEFRQIDGKSKAKDLKWKKRKRKLYGYDPEA